MKRIRHVILGLICILFTLMLNRHVQAIVSSDLDVEVEFGYNNVFRYGDYLPLKVTLTNKGADFDGEVLVRYHLNSSQDAIMKQGVALEQNGTTELNFTMTNVTENLNVVRIILQSDGKEIYNKKVTLPFLQGVFVNTKIIGVMSDTRDSIAYVQPQDKFVKIPLTEEVFPEDYFAMHMFDVVLINNYDISRLSDAQQDVLIRWVDDGGELILGTGARYPKVMPLIQKLQSTVTISGTREVSVDTLGTYGGESSEGYVSDKPLSLANINGLSNEHIDSLDVDSDELIYTFNKGSGRVRLLAFDLGMTPIDGYPYKTEVARGLFTSSTSNKRGGNYYDSYNYNTHRNANRFLWGIPDIELPNLWTIIIIIAVYILIINPTLYLILKRMKKRHYMWVIIPALAILFMVVMFITGVNTRIKNPVTQVINTVLFKETGRSSNSYGTVINSNKSNLTITSMDGLRMEPLTMSNYYGQNGYGNSTEYQDYPVRYEKIVGLNTGIDFVGTSALKNYNFELDATGLLPAENKIKTDLIYDGKQIQGTITNGYSFDLTDCMVRVKNTYYVIKRISAGETVDLGTLVPYEFDSVWEFDNLLYDNHMTLQDRQNNAQNERIRDTIYEYNRVDHSKFTFIAFTNEAFHQGFRVNNKQAKNYEKTLICINEGINYASGSTIVFDYRDIRPEINDMPVDDYYYLTEDSTDMVYQLPVQDVDIKTIAIRTYNSKSMVSYQLVNGEIVSEDFDTLREELVEEVGSSNKDVRRGEDILVCNGDMLTQYISETGTLTIRVNKGEDDEIEIPEIYVEGIGK